MMILTGLFWEVSEMSSLGLLFLVFLAPVICGLLLLRHRKHFSTSRYHHAVRRLAMWYLLGKAVLIGVIVTIL